MFQFFQLLPGLTAIENVMLPMDFARRLPARERRARALGLLVRLGVADQADKLPGALSAGQQQRIAVARALANAPALLLADEPTGSLDSANATALLQLFAELVREGQSVVMVSHGATALNYATRLPCVPCRRSALGLIAAVAAWLAALPLSLPLSLALGEAFGRVMFVVPPRDLPVPAGVLAWFGLALLIAVLASLWPASRAVRVPVARALGYA